MDFPVIGIYLGNNNCCAAVYNNNVLKLLKFNKNGKQLPTYIYYSPNSKKILIGNKAKEQKEMEKENVIFDMKSFIGINYSDREFRRNKRNYQFKFINNEGKPYIQLQYNNNLETISPIDITKLLFDEIREASEKINQSDKPKAVLTIPEYFDFNQKNAVIQSAESAKFEIINTIREPIAASIAYSYLRNENKLEKKDYYELIFDFGSVFSATVLHIGEKKRKIEIYSNEFDLHLGNKEICKKVIKYFKKMYKKQTKTTFPVEKIDKLTNECERVVKELKTSSEIIFDKEYLEIDVDINIKRKEFEGLIKPVIDEVLSICNKLFAKGERKEERVSTKLVTVIKPYKRKQRNGLYEKLYKEEVHHVILTGSLSNMPIIQRKLKEMFKRADILKEINPEEVIAKGAAISGTFKEFNYKISDIVANSIYTDIDIDTLYEIIPKGAVFPYARTITFSIKNDNQKEIAFNIFTGEGQTINDENVKCIGKKSITVSQESPKVEIKTRFEIDKDGKLYVTKLNKDRSEKHILTLDII